MGKKKTTQSTTNTYSHIAPPTNQYYTAAAAQNQQRDYETPVRDSYARQRNAINESGNEFYGASQNPQLAEKIRKNRLFSSFIDEGAAVGQARAAQTNDTLNTNLALGDATRPQLVQTGGTSVMTQPYNWGGLIGQVGQGASGAAAM